MGFEDWQKISPTVPCSISTPLSITATLSQIRFTTSISCVINNMVMPSSSLIFLSKVKIDWVVAGSSAEVASSHKRTFGSDAKARAMATRCFFVRLTDWQGKHLFYRLSQPAQADRPLYWQSLLWGCLIIQAVGQCFQKSRTRVQKIKVLKNHANFSALSDEFTLG